MRRTVRIPGKMGACQARAEVAAQAIAQAKASPPAGALFVLAPQDVAFQWAGSWNMPTATAPIPPGHPLVPQFKDGDWIVGLDEHAESDSWMPELPQSWVVLPLNHLGT
jgi:hypothetical protein